jgi:porin
VTVRRPDQRTNPIRLAPLLLAASCCLHAASVQESPAPQADDGSSETAEPPAPDAGRVTQFGGTASVGARLNQDARKPISEFLAPYRRFKDALRQEHGLAFGLDYNVLFQGATASLGEDTAASGAFRAYGDWRLVGGESSDSGSLVFKVENRHGIGTDVAPQGLATEIGYAGLTSTTFSDAEWLLTNLYWHQQFFDNRLAFVLGVVDTTDYVDIYGLANPWTDFSNLAFQNGPTIPNPSQGLGAAARGLLTDNLYVLAGLADANGDPSRPLDAVDSFFDAEFFSHVEFGWIPSFERRFTDNVHFTAWYANARSDVQTPSGWGLAFSYNQLIGETWEPFVRVGYSDGGGALWEWTASIGVGYHLRGHDLLGIGLNWGRPSDETFESDLDDQYTAEIYYRLQLVENLTITPDVQLLIDPALNPDEDLIAVFGVRARIVF